MLEKYQQIMINSWKIRTEIMTKLHHESDQNLICQILCFCKESNVFLSFYHKRLVQKKHNFHIKSMSEFQSKKNDEGSPENDTKRIQIWSQILPKCSRQHHPQNNQKIGG